MSDQPLQFKFIVIGCSGAGKTSIVRRLVDNKFVKGTQSTVGIEYFTHITTIEGRTIKMMIWDTAGQERFYTIAKAYFRSALGVVLVFDITDRKSFDQLPRWLRDARMEADPHCSVILVGNKTDLAANRVVSKEEAEEFARSHELTYIETSAAENVCIEEVFMKTGADLLRKAASGEINVGTAAPNGGSPVVNIRKTDDNKKQQCC
ncbi:Ras family protein [Tritrichomonas foetus]|uniref:Ras family protein n=1 Tax=Tritrichomonas foetus TaxID=1144522 RepID=A0A1J4JNN9_9EUKA|nr:Ras family protein [Tritrichomonas foetus]|eukprot:OHT00751.1 Ras family protein [Tritrichomonas foetus]